MKSENNLSYNKMSKALDKPDSAESYAHKQDFFSS